ncbi:MAG: ROK family protein [Clostridia bacterium]|nr:ROK family protein [Clostridia bacterium]
MKYYIGIDIGGMSVKAGVVGDNGEIISQGSCQTFTDKHYSVMVADTYKLCEKILKEANLTKEDVSAVGIGCPGTIWSDKGIITYANNLHFDKVPLVAEFKKYWDTKVVIENDANCAALGEYAFGSGKGSKDCIFITLGTGVGSGIILDGKIYSGKRGAGGEAGHMVIKLDGEKCTCGRRGCWEVYASATALIRDTKTAMAKHPESLMHKIAESYGKISAKTSFEAAKQGDKLAVSLIKRYVKYVSAGVVNLINIFRPDVVMIGGGVSNEGQYFIDMIQKYVNKYHYGGRINPKVKIVRATLINNAGIIGAASLVMNI